MDSAANIPHVLKIVYFLSCFFFCEKGVVQVTMQSPAITGTRAKPRNFWSSKAGACHPLVDLACVSSLCHLSVLGPKSITNCANFRKASQREMTGMLKVTSKKFSGSFDILPLFPHHFQLV